MENGNISQGEGKDPSSFLSDIIGNPVTVKLNSGVVYKGECVLHHIDVRTCPGQ
ncbi:U4/U6-U5 snRNP complex subunit lsm6 [Fusarium falciforme]|nr:U4/U6-U5 snRNP complex subunit lsm6 [Fusarium falciforme]